MQNDNLKLKIKEFVGGILRGVFLSLIPYIIVSYAKVVQAFRAWVYPAPLLLLNLLRLHKRHFLILPGRFTRA